MKWITDLRSGTIEPQVDTMARNHFHFNKWLKNRNHLLEKSVWAAPLKSVYYRKHGKCIKMIHVASFCSWCSQAKPVQGSGQEIIPYSGFILFIFGQRDNPGLMLQPCNRVIHHQSAWRLWFHYRAATIFQVMFAHESGHQLLPPATTSWK